MEKKDNKIKQFFKDLGSSIVDTRSLFKFSIYSWITPLIIIMLTISIMFLPMVISYNNLTSQDIVNDVKHIDKVLAHTLSKDFKCSVSNLELNCEEKYLPFNYTYTNEDGLEYKYSIYVNSDVSEIDFSVGTFEAPAPNENYLIFFKSTFRYRYVYRDPASKRVTEYQLTSFYDKLEGLNFEQIKQNALEYSTQEEQDKYLLEQSNEILLNGFKGLLKETIFISVVSNCGIYLLFLLVVSLLIKGNYLLKRKKGFTFSQSIKISIVASIQSLFIAIVLMLMGLDFVTALGLSLTARILYIYIKYTGSSKNITWMDDLYKLTNNERFKL